MKSLDPWANIRIDTPAGQLHARRIDESHPHDFYWAIDADGHRMLVFRAKSPVATLSLPSLRGIHLELESDRLILRLIQNSDLEIFSTLCWSLIDRTRSAEVGHDVIARIAHHLERWQRFLGRGNHNLLTDEQIRGLFCELVFLEQELISRFGYGAIAFWRGPAGDPQDFSVGTTLFEIKSHMAGAAPVLTISSAEQLWHVSGELFLVAYAIGETVREASGAISLSGLVTRLRNRLTGAEMAELFEDRLLEVRYTDHPQYDQKFFSISVPDAYRVTDDFPRITKAMMRPGVCRVKYGIEIAACLPFKVEPDWGALGATHGC